MNSGSKIKVRNWELAIIAKRDPARLRTRTVEPERTKLVINRARRKQAWRKAHDQA